MNLELTNEKLILLGVNIIIGLLLIYSYYHYGTKSGIDINKLWGGAIKAKNLYILSMLLTLIGYILMITFVIFKTLNNKKNSVILSNLIVIQIVIITISMIWMPLSILYLKEKRSNHVTMFAVVITLFIVAMAAAKQFQLVRNLIPEKNNCAKIMKTLAVGGAGYFFIHTFFFDFIGWNIGFFK